MGAFASTNTGFRPLIPPVGVSPSTNAGIAAVVAAVVGVIVSGPDVETLKPVNPLRIAQAKCAGPAAEGCAITTWSAELAGHANWDGLSAVCAKREAEQTSSRAKSFIWR